MRTLEQRFPCFEDMQKQAQHNVPQFAWDYLIGGIGAERCINRNAKALQNLLLMPDYLNTAGSPNLTQSFLGMQFNAPFGIAPLGLAGLIWPGSEQALALAAKHHNIPYILSTFSNISLEKAKIAAGQNGWFQFYPPNNPDMEQDMLTRAHKAGYSVLVLTVDIPAGARRERDIRNGLAIPPSLTLRTVLQALQCPAWCAQILRYGIPNFANLAPYFPAQATLAQAANFLDTTMRGHITAERFKAIRARWPGKIIVKGVLSPKNAAQYATLGADALCVSNHGGRQLDAAPTVVSVLPAIRHAVGPHLPLMADGGVRSGLDIARLLALGADFVLAGRPFLFAMAAIGNKQGGLHAINVFKDELRATMAQLGCTTPAALASHLYPNTSGLTDF